MDLRKTVNPNPIYNDFITDLDIIVRPNTDKDITEKDNTQNRSNSNINMSENSTDNSEVTARKEADAIPCINDIPLPVPTDQRQDGVSIQSNESEREGDSGREEECPSTVYDEHRPIIDRDEARRTTTVSDSTAYPSSLVRERGNTQTADMNEVNDIQAPLWVTVLLNRIDENNMNLTQQIKENNSYLTDRIQQKIKESNLNMTQQMKENNMKIEKIDSNIKSYVRALDHKIEVINEAVMQNCIDIKEIKIAQTNNEHKIHQVQNEAKAQLFKAITNIQKDTCETIKSECDKIEGHLTHRIKTVENKLTSDILNQQQLFDIEITDIKGNIEHKVEEIIHNNPIMNDINHKVTQCEVDIRRINELRANVTPNVYVTCSGGINGIMEQIPKFYGRTTNVTEFINKLKKFYERGINNHNQRNPTEYLIDVIEQALEQHASRWFILIKNEINTWNDFEEAFMSKYWSRETQRSLKQKMETEKYRESGTLNRTEYFIERVIMLKSIIPQPTQEEIVQCLSLHFNETIQSALRVQNVQSIREFEQLLQREDLRDQHTRPKHQPSRNVQPINQSYNRHSPNNNQIYRPNHRPAPYESDRRMPVNHAEYPTRHSAQQNYNRPVEFPRNQPSQRNFNNEYRRPNRQPMPPDRPYSPNRNPRHSYPTAEQSRVCSAVLDRSINRTSACSSPSNSPSMSEPNLVLNSRWR